MRSASICASPRVRLQVAWLTTTSDAMVCSSAGASSSMASALRPARLYVAPKAAAIKGKLAGRPMS